MKRITKQLTYPTILTLTAVFLAFVVLAGATPSIAALPKASKTDRTETRIKDLHARLQITPEQEELWTNVAQTMRDNAKTMEALIKTRSEGKETMSAIEDLKSYAEIADAHADGLKNFIPAFEPLYASMSDAQKKSADTLFHRGHHGGMKHHKAKAKK
jgi:periplasmic protein CpxP/Spy